MHTQHERGFALLLALFLTSALSVLGASLMFLSQSETQAGMNYRMMSQARYAAEGGIQKASGFLLNPGQYPTPTEADLLGPLCDRTVSPVTCNGEIVVLSASPSKTANLSARSSADCIQSCRQGTDGRRQPHDDLQLVRALLALHQFDAYGATKSVTATWEITSEGGISGAPRARVEILALVETPKTPASSYAAFASDDTCGALTFGGNTTINSYDSTGLTGTTAPTMSTTGGDVGTNGNLAIGGSVDVQGNLYTPRTGVGSCTGGAVDALTIDGRAQVAGSWSNYPPRWSIQHLQCRAPRCFRRRASAPLQKV